MTRRIWRVFHRDFIRDPFDGEGARRVGGRWNSEGVPVVYCAGSLALAVLEILVNAESPLYLSMYSAVPADVDEVLVSRLAEKDIPPDWKEQPTPFKVKKIGDVWIAAGLTPVLEVPSAVVPLEKNYLINPRHPDFGKIQLGKPVSLPIDQRLLNWKKQDNL